MKQSRRKTAYLLFVTVVIFITAVFSTVSYAWLINSIHGDFGFNAGKLDPLKLEIARINVDGTKFTYEETDRGETEEGTGNKIYKACTNNKIETKEDGTRLDATLGNMSFGAIDNVAKLNNENVVYFRLTVPKSLGDTVKLNFRYSSDDFIELFHDTFDKDGTFTGTQQITDTTLLGNLRNLENDSQVVDELTDGTKEYNSYLLFDAVVSNVERTPTQIAETFESTSTSAEQKFVDAHYKKFVTNSVYSGDTATYTLTLTNPNVTDDPADDTDNNFYVYVKVVPNLALLAHSIEYITEIMPCYMFFKVSATFEALFAETTPAA